MTEEIETLNLNYHVKQLTLRALNTCKSKIAAAASLGVTEKTLYNYIKQFNIKREGEYWGQYYIPEKLKVAI